MRRGAERVERIAVGLTKTDTNRFAGIGPCDLIGPAIGALDVLRSRAVIVNIPVGRAKAACSIRTWIRLVTSSSERSDKAMRRTSARVAIGTNLVDHQAEEAPA
jgi:hypothetical protein